MKTDRFAESIRRKLESIRPDYTENDWLRMQQTMRQAGVPTASVEPVVRPLWGARPWLLAAACLSSVVLLAYSTYQYQQIRHLRQTVRDLTQTRTATPKMGQTTPAQPTEENVPTGTTDTVAEQARVELGNTAPSVRVDTVYITRYVPMPAGESTREQPRRLPADRVEGYVRGEPAPDLAQPDRSVEAKPATTIPPKQRGKAEYVAKGKTTRPAAGADGLSASATGQNAERRVANSKPNQSRINAQTSTNQSDTNAGDQVAETAPTTRATTQTPAEPEPNQSVAAPAHTDVAQVSARSLTLATADWHRVLQRRAPHTRPVRSAVINEQAPESQPVEQVTGRFRVGVGGDLTTRLSGGGVYAEAIIGKRLTLGIGLIQGVYQSGRFLSDDDFDRRTKRNFRKEFAGGLDPRRDILNIESQLYRTQIPLMLGYRLPLSPSLTIIPSVGTYLNLTNREVISYNYRQPQGGFGEASLPIKRPVELIDSFTFSTSLEWQSKHWVLQGGPVLNVSAQTVTFWPETASVGGRVRLFYQF